MLRSILLSVLLAIAGTVHAEESHYNRVDFSTEAAREVGNDLLQAQMRVEVSDQSPAQIAKLLNTALNDAMKKAAAFPAVKAASGNHTTYPIYGKNNRLDGWRGSAQIHLESRDFKAAGELIGELQTSMQLAGVSFTVAPETRRKIEDELVGEALAAFRKRAEAIRESLGGRDYKIVHVAINNGGYQPQPQLDRMFATKAESAAPQFSGGDSALTVQISGTIEMISLQEAQVHP